MAGRNYQALDDGPSGSDSWGKLRALRLPPLMGKSFLDVGCNAGFFCGFALSAGASRVVGIDRNPAFTRRARQLFPEAEFLTGDWAGAPAGPFDVILLASSLHYAPDPGQLVVELMDRLGATGILVLEVGVDHGQSGDGYFRVRRPGGDTVLHTQRNTIRMQARAHGWRYRPVGPSVSQPGDPIPRYVYHLGRRVPNAWLLLQPPTYGKSDKAQRLAALPATTVIHGDAVLLQIARDSGSCSEDLQGAAAAGLAGRDWSVSYRQILEDGCEAEFVGRALRSVQPGVEPVIDAFFPQWAWSRIADALAAHGYNPVHLNWDHPIALVDLPVYAGSERTYGQWLSQRTTAGTIRAAASTEAGAGQTIAGVGS